MGDGTTRRILAEMLREEWRLHGRLFGDRRFLAFPALVVLFVAGSVALLQVTGTPVGTMVLGLHALAFLFGLHTGSIGHVGRDALENLVGDVTLLVFSGRTLPLSSRRLLGIFVVKDVVYYAGLFLLPMAVGLLPAVGLSPAAARTVALVWGTLTATFVLGVATTLAGAGLADRGVPGLALIVAVVGGGVLAWQAGLDLAAVTGYGLYVAPSLPRLGATLATLAVLVGVGVATFEPSSGRSPRRAGPSLRLWRDRLGDPVAAKSVLDLARSSGGVWKVAFSGAVIFGVTAALIRLAEAITGVTPSAGVTYGSVLGLSAFTTYNWLTRFDDVDAYLLQPLDVDDVFAGKLRAFLAAGPTTALAFYVLALAWEGTRLPEAIVGALLAVGVSVYVLGVTAYLAGFAPHEFLFDTVLFAAFSMAMALPLVPVLVVGVGYAPLSLAQAGGLAAGAAAMGVVGMAAYRGAIPRWRTKLRAS